MVKALKFITLSCIISAYLFVETEAVRCYQCGSDSDSKNEDLCGAYEPFDKNKHISIDCNDEDSKMPGSFCVKEIRQGPRGFIWDGRFRQVVRRCASVAETGVTNVCNWGVDENGVYWQQCYCSEDSCNGATSLSSSLTIATIISFFITIHFIR
ncbi:UPAR/Ly6 domain-containing protein qvr [Cotesia typhae]